MRLQKEIVFRSFEGAATLMQWDITSPRWTKCDATETKETGFYGPIKATVGRVSMDKFGHSNRYQIIELCNVNGGERVIHYPCSGEEMLQWLQGLCYGFRTARAASTPCNLKGS